MISKSIYAISTLSGTIIGVGLFSLPYLTTQVGLLTMAVYLVVLTAVSILIHRVYAEVVVNTSGSHMFPGYAEKYLGTRGKKIAAFSTLVGRFGGQLVYLLVGGKFLTTLFIRDASKEGFLFLLIYAALGAIVVGFGLKTLGKIEFWGLLSFLLIIFILLFSGFSKMRFENFPWVKSGDFLLPYGPLLFSLTGASMIPVAKQILIDRGAHRVRELRTIFLNRVIPISILIPAVIYLIFLFLVVGITGSSTTEEAITGLRSVLSPLWVSLILCFGFLTTFTSYIAFGQELKNVFQKDFRLSATLAWLVSSLLPLALYFLGFNDFIGMIGFLGAVLIGIDGILMIGMYRRAVSKPSYSMLTFVMAFFFLGILLELVSFFRR